MDTELGRIASLSHEAVQESTTLQNEMKNISQKVHHRYPYSVFHLGHHRIVSAFLCEGCIFICRGIAAAMIPEGLPAEVSIALSLASGRLAKNGALVKQLASVETLGCVNIICTDKT